MMLLVGIALVGALSLAVPSRADVSPSYPETVWADGFESGSLSAWNGAQGTGSVTVSAAGAHSGTYGVRLTNALSQYSLVAKTLPATLTDSSTSFWVRTSATSGIIEVAQARDQNSSARMWELMYDAGAHGFYFYPYSNSGSTEIYTGAGSANAANTWVKVEIQYNAATGGGARIFINGATQAAWGISADLPRTTNYTILQLWNDGTGSTDFDDVSVNKPSSAPTAPGAPTGVGGTGGNASVALSWTAPASNGGSAITGYRITPYIGSTAQTAINTGSTSTSYNVTGLTNGTAYTFKVAATNAIGTGADSAASASITPRAANTAPGAPTNVTGTAGNASVALTWSAPSDNGGAAITGYRVTPYIGSTAQTAINTGSTSTSYNVTGLTNGTAYTFTVAATNSVGTGSASAPTIAITPTASGYTDVQFTDGFESGNLSNWSAPQGNGSVTAAAAAAHQGGYGARLQNTGSQYSLLPKALPNALPDSSTKFSFRTSLTTGMETIAQARDNASSARMWELWYDAGTKALYFYPYKSSGSVAIYTGANSAPGANTWMDIEVRYTASSTGGAQLYINGQTQAAWGTTGDFSRTTNYQILQLWNDGASTNDFDDVTVARPASGPTAPGIPTAVGGTAGDSSVALSWTAPASNGGSPITGYRITPYIGTTAQTPINTGSASTSFNVTGLTNNTAYTFTVAATNAVGTGIASTPSAALTPRPAPTAPGAPTNVTGTAGNGSVQLIWTAPADNGGSAITSYRVTPYIGSTAQTPINTGGAATGATVSGLTNGTAYTFRVAATNAVGTGADSAASGSLTPQAPTVPGTPGTPTGAVGDKTITVSWTAPSSDGGSPITSYRITPYIGSTAQTAINTGTTATSYPVTGLTNGTAYTFRVAATNAVGTGAQSAASASYTPLARKVVVSLEFDDDIQTQYQLKDTLKSHGMHATFYINSGLTGDDPGAWRMTWTELLALQADGNELGGHTWDHADLQTAGQSAWQHEICDDRQNIISHGGTPVVSFAYPYGGYEQTGIPAFAQSCGYTSGRTVGGIRSSVCSTCPFAETIPPANPMVTRTPPDIRINDTLATVQGYVTQAENNGGGWVQLVFHDICATGCTGDTYSTTPTLFNQLLDWLQPRAAQGTVVETVRQVMTGG